MSDKGYNPNTKWNKFWVWGFALSMASWLLLIPFISAKLWLLGMGINFGILEGIGLKTTDDSLPPLTYICRRYLKRWMVAILVGFFTGLAGGYWFGFKHPLWMAALLALYSWGTEHFDVTWGG